MAEHGYHIELLKQDYNQWVVDYYDWIIRHAYNIRWALDYSAIEIHVEFCAFIDWMNLKNSIPMNEYPSFDERKTALANTHGNPVMDFIGPLAGVQGLMKSKGADIYNHDEALYRYTEDPETEGIWWNNSIAKLGEIK